MRHCLLIALLSWTSIANAEPSAQPVNNCAKTFPSRVEKLQQEFDFHLQQREEAHEHGGSAPFVISFDTRVENQTCEASDLHTFGVSLVFNFTVTIASTNLINTYAVLRSALPTDKERAAAFTAQYREIGVWQKEQFRTKSLVQDTLARAKQKLGKK